MSAFDTTKTTSTSLPQWFSNAQQNIATQAGNIYNATPQPGQTAGANMVQALTGPNDPFSTAQNTFSTVAKGATTPFNADGTPNTGSPLGALFAAQNTQLNQILPEVAAKEGAAGIGSGNYGGLRGQTAVNTAKAGALNTLATQQDQTALNALSQANQAASGMTQNAGTMGTTDINAANWQMSGGLPALASYSNIVNAMGPNMGKTETATTNSGLTSNLASAGNLLQQLGTQGGNIVNGKTGISWLDNIINGGGGGGLSDLGGGITLNSDGSFSGGTDFLGGSGSTGDLATDQLTGLV